MNSNKTLLVGSSDPTTSTVGTLGLLYKNTTSGDLFKCTAVDSITPSYTWENFGDDTSVVIRRYS